MITIPNQSSLPKAWLEFENGRMKPSSFYNRVVDVMEELARFTVMTRGRKEIAGGSLFRTRRDGGRAAQTRLSERHII